jgi:integrase
VQAHSDNVVVKPAGEGHAGAGSYATRNPAEEYLSSLHPRMRARARQVIDLAVGVLAGRGAALDARAWSRLDGGALQQLEARLARQLPPGETRKAMSTLRAVARLAALLGPARRPGVGAESPVSPAVEASSQARGQRRVAKVKPLLAANLLSGEGLSALLEACGRQSHRRAARDMALVALAFECGLGCDDISGLVFGDYDPGAGTLVVRRGSRSGSPRLLAERANRLLSAWVAARGGAAGPLFAAAAGDGRSRPLGARQVLEVLLQQLNATVKAASLRP